MTASRPTPSASWSSGTTRLRGKHSTLRIHSWLPHGALNGSNGWTHNLEAREPAIDTAICGLQHNCREQRLTPETRSVGTEPEADVRATFRSEASKDAAPLTEDQGLLPLRRPRRSGQAERMESQRLTHLHG